MASRYYRQTVQLHNIKVESLVRMETGVNKLKVAHQECVHLRMFQMKVCESEFMMSGVNPKAAVHTPLGHIFTTCERLIH